MQLIGIILAALVILAAAHAIAGVLALLLVVLLVWGLYARPAETFGLFAFALLSALVKARPLACLVALTGLAGGSLLLDRKRNVGQPTPKLGGSYEEPAKPKSG